MKQDLTNVGFTELQTPDEVDAALNAKTGTALVVVNSVCGCAAGACRPGVKQAIAGNKKPDHYTRYLQVLIPRPPHRPANISCLIRPRHPVSPCSKTVNWRTLSNDTILKAAVPI
jgi:putative YphP/YqiW family bacilliredoxin